MHSLRPAALLSGLALMTLAGCTTLTTSHTPTIPAQQGQQALDQAADCCSSLATLPYQALTAQQTITLPFDTDTPAHQFEDGKSFFHAFRLPRDSGPLTLNLVSPIENKQVFAPTLLVLDDAFQPVKHVDSDKFVYQAPNGFSDAHLDGTLNIVPGPEAAYLVIYSSADARQASTRYESPEKVYARVRGLEPPAVPDPVAQHTATGQVTLKVAPLDESGGLLAPLIGRSNTSTTSYEPATAPATVSQPAAATTSAGDDLDYRRMIDAALKAGDIELALELADRAEQAGQSGTRAWLAKQLRARTP